MTLFILYALSSRTRRSSCTSAGPYGGGGGGAFNELPDNCNAVVSQILIRSGEVVDAFQFSYMYSNGNGKGHTGGYRGGTGGGSSSFHVDVAGGERVVGVIGQSGELVDSLGFITNWGRIFGPHGGNGGGRFQVSSCLVRGNFGRSGSSMDAIGFYCDDFP